MGRQQSLQRQPSARDRVSIFMKKENSQYAKKWNSDIEEFWNDMEEQESQQIDENNNDDSTFASLNRSNHSRLAALSSIDENDALDSASAPALSLASGSSPLGMPHHNSYPRRSSFHRGTLDSFFGTKKSVSFPKNKQDLAQVFVTLGKSDYTKDEWQNTWYSKKEDEQLEARRNKVLARLERQASKIRKAKASKEPNSKSSALGPAHRGLEWQTPKGKKKRENIIHKVVHATMDEQDRQYDEGFPENDDILIAQISRALSAKSVKAAFKLGQKDENEARKQWIKTASSSSTSSLTFDSASQGSLQLDDTLKSTSSSTFSPTKNKKDPLSSSSHHRRSSLARLRSRRRPSLKLEDFLTKEEVSSHTIDTFSLSANSSAGFSFASSATTSSKNSRKSAAAAAAAAKTKSSRQRRASIKKRLSILFAASEE